MLLLLDHDLCGECGGCVAVCAPGALEFLPPRLNIKQQLCTLCEDCVTFCPTGAIQIEASQDEAPFPSQAQMPDPKDG